MVFVDYASLVRLKRKSYVFELVEWVAFRVGLVSLAVSIAAMIAFMFMGVPGGVWRNGAGVAIAGLLLLVLGLVGVSVGMWAKLRGEQVLDSLVVEGERFTAECMSGGMSEIKSWSALSVALSGYRNKESTVVELSNGMSSEVVECVFSGGDSAELSFTVR